MTEVNNNIIDHENNDQANPPLRPPHPNGVKLIIVNNTGNQLIRGSLSDPNGKVTCTHGNGYIGADQIVTYIFKNTFDESINCSFNYEIFSVGGDFTTTISGTLGKTPSNGYVTTDGPGWGAKITVVFLSEAKGIKTYIMYIENIQS